MAVMDIIGFLCVSLRSSTVLLHGSLDSRCAYSFQMLVSVVKMATAGGLYYRRGAFCCAFFVGKRPQCKGYS
jgi:hypothetical protein